MNLDMPKITEAKDLIEASSALMQAVADGDLVPGEAAALGQLVGSVAQAVETFQNAERIAKLEEALAERGSAP